MALMKMPCAVGSGTGFTAITGLIPRMTSDSQDGVTLSSSGQLSGFAMYYACDRNNSGTNSSYAVFTPQTEVYAEITFNSSKTVKAIMLENTWNTAAQTAGEFYNDVVFKAYNGSTWDELGSGTNASNNVSEQTLFAINNTKSYTKYRIIFNGNHGGTYISVGAIQLFGE